jgi:hypothetical protein
MTRAYPWRRLGAEAAISTLGVGLLCLAFWCDAHWVERHFQESRCVRDPRALGIAWTWRAVALGAGAALVAVARPRFGRWVGGRSPRELAGVFLRLGIAVALALVASELVLRWRTKPFVPFAHHDDLPPVEPSLALSWTLTTSHTLVVHRGERHVAYAVNAWGARARTQDDNPDAEAPTILFAGESVLFGLSVPFEQTFPALVGEHLRVQTFNAGVHGYGGDQTYLRTLEILPHLRRPLAVVTMVLPEQISRNVDENRRRLRIVGEGIFAPEEAVPEWVREVRMRALLRTLVPYHGDDAWDLERAFLRSTARAVRERGAFPLFLVTNFGAPCLPVEGEAPWLTRQLLADADLPTVSVDLPPEWSFADDPHPDARAQQKLAAAVEAALRGAHVAGLAP